MKLEPQILTVERELPQIEIIRQIRIETFDVCHQSVSVGRQQRLPVLWEMEFADSIDGVP